MFGFSGSEFIVIFFVGLLILKPEDLPIVLKKIGQFYGQLRRMYIQIMDEIQSYIPEEEEIKKVVSQHSLSHQVQNKDKEDTKHHDSKKENM